MSDSRNLLLLRPSPLVLPADCKVARVPPRKPEERQPDYMEKYDFRTLYYDVFEVDNEVFGIGPPLRNLEDFVNSAVVSVDGCNVDMEIDHLDRTQVTRFLGSPKGGGSVSIHHALGGLSCEIGRDLTGAFAGMDVVVTKSKNNSLDWIYDWARHYAINHGINGVVIYDNASSEYAAEDVLSTLGRVPGLLSCAVVKWNFPWGSPGGIWAGGKNVPWDSDYCQYGALEHARRRFLGRAGIVINHDIDELLVTPNDEPVTSLVRKMGVQGITYGGRWVETVGGARQGQPRFFNFAYYDRNRAACTKKWVVNQDLASSAKQWKLHGVVGVALKEASGVMHRHFMGINNNWKRVRTHQLTFDKRHLLDHELSTSLARSLATPVSMSRRGLVSSRLVGEGEAAARLAGSDAVFAAYWRPTRGNIGGGIGAWLVSMITGRKVRNVHGAESGGGALASVGSFLNHVGSRDLCVWGSGAISSFSKENKENFFRFRPRKILATRGHLTRAELMAMGVDVPPVVGDPVLLLPRYYVPAPCPSGIVVCPDANHQKLLQPGAFDGHCVLDVKQPVHKIVSRIANATCCISTSLYGLVVAQAYGVPWIWLCLDDKKLYGDGFQFDDFFSLLDSDSVVRVDVRAADLAGINYRKLAEKARLPRVLVMTDELLDAFPA